MNVFSSSRTVILTCQAVIALASAVFVAGCASVSVSNVREEKSLAPSSNAVVTVFPFGEAYDRGGDTLFLGPKGEIYRKGRGEKKTKGGRGEALARSLTKALKRQGIAVGQERDLEVRGEITVLSEGSRPLRTILGLGAGRSRVDSQMRVYNLQKSKTVPWLTVWSTGGSGREPGAIFAAVPGPGVVGFIGAGAGAVGSGITHSGKGADQDARRTGRVFADTLAWKLNLGGEPKRWGSARSFADDLGSWIPE